jgi:CBS domain-containing protein
MPRHAERRSAEPLPTVRPLTVGDVMTKNVVTIGPDAPIAEAVAMLADAHISGLAVVNSHYHLIGVISSQDILAAEAEAQDAEARARILEISTVRDLMTAPPHTVGPNLELRQAALEMEYADVHRVFVVVDGKVAGVLSRSDISRAFAQNRE